MILPTITELSTPYWEGTKRGELRLQWCSDCNSCWHPPSPVCPDCASSNVEWRPSSGRGRLYSYSICESPVHPSFADKVPYIVALVRLQEGPMIVTNLIDISPREISIGQILEVVFTPLNSEVTLPQFRPNI